MLKRKYEASKVTISVVNWLKNLTLLNVRGSCVNQSKTSAFFIALNFNFFTRTESDFFQKGSYRPAVKFFNVVLIAVLSGQHLANRQQE